MYYKLRLFYSKGGNCVNLEKYFQENNKRLSDVIGQVDYSAEQLENMAVILYPDELIEKLSQSLNKEPSLFIYELLLLENQEKIVKISSEEELAESIRKRVPYLYIPDPVRSEQSRLVHSVLSEKDRLGLELGSKGSINLFADMIYRLQMMFSKESKEFKDLKSKLRNYHLKVQDENGSILYEREQTY